MNANLGTREQKLRTLLDDSAQRLNAMAKLVSLLKDAERHDEAVALCEQLVLESVLVEEVAHACLMRGQLAEKANDYGTAVLYYRLGLRRACRTPEIQYFLLNNLGFSLNQLGQFEDAEPLCRRALEIGIVRGNAYKNLGLSLKGQGKLLEAAQTFAQGMDFFPMDPRNLDELTRLQAENPFLLESDPQTWDLAEKWLSQ